jgi:hypothetical protein
VRWDDGLESLGRRVVAAVPSVRAEVQARLGFPDAAPRADVSVVSGLERMRAVARAAVPEWAAGVTIGGSRIVLRADRLLAGVGGGLIPVLRHEWVHLAWAQRAGPRSRFLPLWLEEGIAEEIGGEISLDGGEALDLAAAFGRLIPLEEISSSWPQSPERAALAYRQGRSWTQYFAQRQGWGDVRAVLAALADGPVPSADGLAPETPFEAVVRERTGHTVGEWHADWRHYVEEAADPWYRFLLRDLWTTLIAAVAVIGGVAYLFLRRRRRRQIQALPEYPGPAPGGDDEEAEGR